jgi:hypothetical protein
MRQLLRDVWHLTVAVVIALALEALLVLVIGVGCLAYKL